MKHLRALIDGEVIAYEVKVADRFLQKLIGLLKHSSMAAGEGLLIRPCSQIHTIGMKFNIDVVFITKAGEVLHLEENIPPGVVSSYIYKSHQVLELKSGTISEKGIVVGKFVAFDTMN